MTPPRSAAASRAVAIAMRRHQALDLIAEARAAAVRMGSTAADHRLMFSMPGVEVYQIGIHTALGDSAAALASARSVIQAYGPADSAGSPPVQAR